MHCTACILVEYLFQGCALADVEWVKPLHRRVHINISERVSANIHFSPLRKSYRSLLSNRLCSRIGSNGFTVSGIIS